MNSDEARTRLLTERARIEELRGAANRLTADAQETYDFVAGLYEANQFSFDKLVPWLRNQIGRAHV